jgi:ribose 5-phosphate isomerase B
LLCGSGQGVCITANKHQGIRAALVWDTPLAVLARQHNDVNVLCLPARFISLETAQEAVGAFLTTEFEGGRHQGRVTKISCS